MNALDQPLLPSALESLLANSGLPGLGPAERSERRARATLDSQLDEALQSLKLAPEAQRLIRCAVLLWHDHLDAAHNIAQEIETPDGSWLHGIMHRREPDYWNAKYWFRRVGRHSATASLARHAATALVDLNAAPLAAKLIPGGTWDHLAFVDLCEQVANRPVDDPARRAALAVQPVEIRTLLAHFVGE
jgi:hypothetical protein